MLGYSDPVYTEGIAAVCYMGRNFVLLDGGRGVTY